MNTMQGLDKVLQLHREKQQALKTVKNTQMKRLGQYYMAISDDERSIMEAKVQKFYDSKIKAIYDTMNQEQETKLINPFERGLQE